MARITVKDLPQSDTLDRQAMTAISGGARSGARPPRALAIQRGPSRLVDYPPGFGSTTQPASSAGRSSGA
jgi:hypothetical protein